MLKKLAVLLMIGQLVVINTSLTFAKAFNLSLQDSLDLAMKYSPEIKGAQAEATGDEWDLRTAEAKKMPNISYNHSSGRQETPPSIENYFMYSVWSVVESKFDNNVVLHWPLYTGGKAEAVIKQSMITLHIANIGINKATQQVKLDTTTAYYKVLQKCEMLKVKQDSVVMLKEHLAVTRAEYEAGTIVKSDILRSEVEVSDAQQEQITAQNDYLVAVAALDKLMGLPMDTEINLTEPLKYEKYGRALEECIQLAMNNRPEMQEADKKVEYAKQGISVAKSASKPSVALQGIEDSYSDNFPGIGGNKNWSLTMNVSMNIYDAGQTRNGIEKANTELEKNLQLRQQAKDNAEFEVRQAYLDLKEAEKRIATTQMAVDKAEEDYKIAQLRYSVGDVTNLDVIDAQNAIVKAKSNYIQALFDFNTDRVKTDKASGVI